MQRDNKVDNLFLSTQSMIRAWKNYFIKVLEPENISLTQMGLLFHLGAHQPATGRELSMALHLSPSAVAQLIDGLDQLGYITREAAPADKRIKYFGLSHAGQEKYAALESKRKQLFAHVTASLSDEELETMVVLQNKMTEQIKNNFDQGEAC
jgi:DNA-binding MarR family transcriptional regulator